MLWRPASLCLACSFSGAVWAMGGQGCAVESMPVVWAVVAGAWWAQEALGMGVWSEHRRFR
jgi:hypothetical protein